jgi:Dimerisation domain
MPDPVETPAATFMRLTNGYQLSQAIHVAAELRLADFIGSEPVAADEIAPRVGAHARSLYRLLRALSTIGIFCETNDKRFVGSPMSDLLRTEHAGSMWGWPANIGRPLHREMWGDLLHCVRTGQDAPHHLWGVDIWQYRADKPEEIASFNAAMASSPEPHQEPLRRSSPSVAPGPSRFGWNGLSKQPGCSPSGSRSIRWSPASVTQACPRIRRMLSPPAYSRDSEPSSRLMCLGGLRSPMLSADTSDSSATPPVSEQWNQR